MMLQSNNHYERHDYIIYNFCYFKSKYKLHGSFQNEQKKMNEIMRTTLTSNIHITSFE